MSVNLKMEDKWYVVFMGIYGTLYLLFLFMVFAIIYVMLSYFLQ